jgi:hypothetical protein
MLIKAGSCIIVIRNHDSRVLLNCMLSEIVMKIFENLHIKASGTIISKLDAFFWNNNSENKLPKIFLMEGKKCLDNLATIAMIKVLAYRHIIKIFMNDYSLSF